MSNQRTLEDILYLLVESHSNNGMAGRMSVKQAQSAIESLIAERERLARIDELQHVGTSDESAMFFPDGPVIEISINDRIAELQSTKEEDVR